jgi:peptidyl-prolyl cis-trans isomerase A (cyclophilin A)
MEESQKMRFSRFAASTAALLLFSAVASFGQTEPAQATPAKPKSTTAAKGPSSSYDRALLKPDALKDVAPATYQVKFETTRGDFTVTVTRAWAPIAADRFYNLVKHHYFDNARFFRVVPGFVVQFGLSAYPPVTAAWDKATIKDEPVTQKNKRGTLTFAKTSMPDSRTTQIFINLKDNSSSLDAQGFAPFGVVDGDGMKIVEMFYDQYGDSAGMDQANIEKLGEKYLAEKWPRLDQIKSATIVGDTAAAKPSKPATSTKAVSGKPQP